MKVIEREEQVQEQQVPPPEFPRYFKPKPPLRMWSSVRNCNVVCFRHDDPHCALYYEGGVWDRCDCGCCTLDNTLAIVAEGYIVEITPTEALLLVGSAGGGAS